MSDGTQVLPQGAGYGGDCYFYENHVSVLTIFMLPSGCR